MLWITCQPSKGHCARDTTGTGTTEAVRPSDGNPSDGNHSDGNHSNGNHSNGQPQQRCGYKLVDQVCTGWFVCMCSM